MAPGRTLRIIVFATGLASAALFGVPTSAAADAGCSEDVPQPNGAIYRICMPAAWIGDLVVFAHGYVAARTQGEADAFASSSGISKTSVGRSSTLYRTVV